METRRRDKPTHRVSGTRLSKAFYKRQEEFPL